MELARCFAADQSNLVLVARTTEALEQLATELRAKFPIQVHVLTADLAEAATPQRIFDELKGRGIKVDVVVNNAGFGLHGPFGELPLHRQVEMIQVNVAALVQLTGLFLPGMIATRRGGILNVGSVAGFLPGPNMAVYFATKSFVMSFSEALHEELRGTGVTVTDLCPGPTETNFFKVARGYRARINQASRMPAAAVASAGHHAFRQQQCLSVPGIRNWMLSILPRFASRAIVRRQVARYNKLKD